VGLARHQAEGQTDAALARIQNDLFDLGADLCRPGHDRDAEAEHPPLRLVPSPVDRPERESGEMGARPPPLPPLVLTGCSAPRAALARPARDPDAEAHPPPLRIVPWQLDRLEREIDEMNARLQPLRSFVLPGGSALAAALHLCRTVARRAERETVALTASEDV